MIHHHLVSASNWLLHKGEGLVLQSRVRWSAGGLHTLFFIMWGRKKELLNVNSGLMPPRVAISVTGSLAAGWWVILSFGVHSLKSGEVPASWAVTPDKMLFMTKETRWM